MGKVVGIIVIVAICIGAIMVCRNNRADKKAEAEKEQRVEETRNAEDERIKQLAIELKPLIDEANAAYDNDDYKTALPKYEELVYEKEYTDGIILYRYAYSYQQINGYAKSRARYYTALSHLQDQYPDHRYTKVIEDRLAEEERVEKAREEKAREEEARIAAQKQADRIGSTVSLRELLADPYKFQGIKVNFKPVRVTSLSLERKSIFANEATGTGMFDYDNFVEIEIFYEDLPNATYWRDFSPQNRDTMFNVHVIGVFSVYGNNSRGGYVRATEIIVLE